VTTISSPRRGTLELLAAIAAVGVLGIVAIGCSSGDDETETGSTGSGSTTTDEPADGTADGGDDGGDGAAPSTGEGTLAVDLEPTEGVFVEGFDVTLRIYGADDELLAERDWSEIAADAAGDAPDGYYTHVHEEPVPAGPVRLVSYMRISPGGAIPPPQDPGCETAVDVADGDTVRVTLLFEGDPNAEGGCAAVAAASAEADEMLGMPRGLPAPGIVGLAVDEAEAAATARGWTTRVVAEDGERFMVTEDYNTERVDLVVEEGVVTAAARG
jgi:hypothetical protein